MAIFSVGLRQRRNDLGIMVTHRYAGRRRPQYLMYLMTIKREDRPLLRHQECDRNSPVLPRRLPIGPFLLRIHRTDHAVKLRPITKINPSPRYLWRALVCLLPGVKTHRNRILSRLCSRRSPARSRAGVRRLRGLPSKPYPTSASVAVLEQAEAGGLRGLASCPVPWPSAHGLGSVAGRGVAGRAAADGYALQDRGQSPAPRPPGGRTRCWLCWPRGERGCRSFHVAKAGQRIPRFPMNK